MGGWSREERGVPTECFPSRWIPGQERRAEEARKDEKVWSRARKGIGVPVFVRVVQRHEEGTHVTICRSGLALMRKLQK